MQKGILLICWNAQ